MSDEINFVDMMALSKIGPDTVVEKFGGIINSSFFDASNILGALKIKGLIDFTTSFPGQSAITVTELGKQVLNEGSGKTKEPFDSLDFALISQLSGGKKSLSDLGAAVNIRPRDMAMHLYKLMLLEYLTSTFRNGVLDIALTEKGFLQVKAGMPKPQPQQQPAATAAQIPVPPQPGVGTYAQPLQASQQEMQPSPAQPEQQPHHVSEVEKLISESRKKKARRNITIAFVILLLLIIIALLFKYRIV